MARLVILSDAQMGRSYELPEGTTTVGRVEDNAFQIAEASVSSHHCEIIARPNDVLVRDLNSTNGTFINGQQVTTEAILKPGQILRLGQIELRMEAPATASTGAGTPTPAATTASPAQAPATRPAAAAAPASSRPAAAATATSPRPAAPAKKLPDQTMVIPQGVKLGQDHGTVPPLANGAFSKKSNTGTKVFIGAAIALAVIVVCVLAFVFLNSGSVGQ